MTETNSSLEEHIKIQKVLSYDEDLDKINGEIKGNVDNAVTTALIGLATSLSAGVISYCIPVTREYAAVIMETVGSVWGVAMGYKVSKIVANLLNRMFLKQEKENELNSPNNESRAM